MKVIIPILAFVLIVVAFFRIVLFSKNYYPKAKKPTFLSFFSSIASLLIVFVLFLLLFGIFHNKPEEIALFFIPTFIFYIFICSSLKVITTCIVRKKISTNINCNQCSRTVNCTYESNSFTNAFIFKLEYILISPDYCFAYLCKIHDYYDGGSKKSKSNLIKAFNISNIIISLVVGILLVCFNKYLPNFIVTKVILIFAGIRFVSRSIEIIISFVKDVIDKKKSSSLVRNERITLAFYSLLEIIFFSICIFYCQVNCDFFRAVLSSLTLINGSWSLGDKVDGFDVIKIFESLTCFSLLGIVIASYLGIEETPKRHTGFKGPQLFVFKNGFIQMSLPFEMNEKSHIYELKVYIDSDSYEYIVYFPETDNCQDCYYPKNTASWLSEDDNSAKYASGDRNFCLLSGDYVFSFDPVSKKLAVRKENEANPNK